MCLVITCGGPGKKLRKFRASCDIGCLKIIIICRVPPRAPGKEAFAGCQVMGHPAKKFKKKLKKFFAGCLTAWHPAKADGRWPPSSRPPLPAAIFCRVAGTRQRPIFADG